jgi:hypothetical protein
VLNLFHRRSRDNRDCLRPLAAVNDIRDFTDAIGLENAPTINHRHPADWMDEY